MICLLDVKVFSPSAATWAEPDLGSIYSDQCTNFRATGLGGCAYVAVSERYKNGFQNCAICCDFLNQTSVYSYIMSTGQSWIFKDYIQMSVEGISWKTFASSSVKLKTAYIGVSLFVTLPKTHKNVIQAKQFYNTPKYTIGNTVY